MKKYKVSEETYQKVFNACQGMCVLCSTTRNLQAHHVRYRSEEKCLIDEATNMVMLCLKHHVEVHKNKHYWQPILLKICEDIYGNMEGH